jgi:hypothetical protein
MKNDAYGDSGFVGFVKPEVSEESVSSVLSTVRKR